ncbi:hypothetical protein ANO11243_027130 [Dothideomycetidae sp. 11243]|nr:hypothetical protein ANO11243_027130 [fungal sp. No.11243]
MRHLWEHLTLLDEKSTFRSRESRIRASAVHYVRSFFLFLLPSFLGSGPPRALRDTAFLDGARGLAAWSVFNTHITALLLKTSGAAFGQDGYELWKLPGIRVLFGGEYAVSTFFIISGYALSIGPVAAMRAPADKYFRKFATTVLRRPLRLYLAPLASFVIPFILIRFNVFHAIRTRNMTANPRYIEGWDFLGDWPARTDTLWEQCWDLAKGVASMFHILKQPQDNDFGTHYNGILWTIKVELRGSLLLYLLHASLFYVRRQVRLVVAVGLLLLSFAVVSFEMPMFLFGYLLAETTKFQQALPTSREAPSSRLLGSAGLWTLFAIGLYLGSFPIWEAENVPSYSWLIPITPTKFPYPFWIPVGAAMVMFATSRLAPLRAFYESGPIQYLGKISFSLYLTHFAIVHVFGSLIFADVWDITGKDGSIPAFTGFVIAYPLVLGVAIWVADLFTRLVDEPSVAFAARAQNWLMQA